jgi:hypothetical protein
MKFLSAISLIMLAACQTATPPQDSAVIVDSSPQMLEELEKTMTTALFGVPIKLSAGAFTTPTILTLEPQMQHTPAGRLATGRTVTRPEQFRLIATADGCVLEHVNSGERFTLRVTHCRTE